ncbi:MAG: MBL fold metallo-hydrolase, partial [Desulfobacterales bacterium]|jgi:metallo-beta-lactamase family protein
MKITFLGAVREVTGSMHLLDTGSDRILLDCGLHQGRRKESDEKNRELPFDPVTLTTVVLSHAHIDHSGRLPLLSREAYKGRIVSTRVTADACGYLLRDSAHIQESDAEYLNYKLVRNHLVQSEKAGKKTGKTRGIRKRLKSNGHRIDAELVGELVDRYGLEGISPLYTMADAEAAIGMMDGYPYRHEMTIGKGVGCTFYEAGHILGSSMAMIQVQDNGRLRNICFSGDIGRFDKPILKDPCLGFKEAHRDVDLLIMESTYGDRDHEPVGDLKGSLKTVVNTTHDRGGCVMIPAFAYGRTQELLYYLHELYDEGAVPRLPVYVDSPLATRLTQVFGEHPEVYDQETHQTFLQDGRNPFTFKEVHFVGSVEESMALNRDERPHILISASGMCEAGRILHHLRHKIHNPRHTILVVGFMAQNTLGRRILDLGMAYEASGRQGPAPELRFFNKTYPLNARVSKIGGFSAHGDRNEMLRFLKSSNLNIKHIALVHGEESQSLAFADFLEKAGYRVSVPHLGDTMDIG